MLFLATVIAFAMWVTIHVGTAASLGRPRGRAMLALLVPPYALYCALDQRLFGWAVLWSGSLLAYGVLLVPQLI